MARKDKGTANNLLLWCEGQRQEREQLLRGALEQLVKATAAVLADKVSLTCLHATGQARPLADALKRAEAVLCGLDVA